MYKITIEEVKDYEIHFTKEGIKVISNITGTHYNLLHGESIGKDKQSYFSDIMFIMKMRYEESVDDWIYDNDAFVNYLFGAEFIYEKDPDLLQTVIDIIREYEEKII